MVRLHRLPPTTNEGDAMQVFCKCGKLMGEVLEGSKLRKGYAIVCTECQEQQEKTRQACELFRSIANGKGGVPPFGGGSKNPFGDIFGDIFGKKP